VGGTGRLFLEVDGNDVMELLCAVNPWDPAFDFTLFSKRCRALLDWADEGVCPYVCAISIY
jgi:hypothetical protein